MNPTVADLVHEYATSITLGFGKGAGRPTMWATLGAVREISSLPAGRKIKNLGPAQFTVIREKDMVLSGEDTGEVDPEAISPTGTCIAAIYKILEHSSQGGIRFLAVHPGEVEDPRYLGFGINAWHRGWVALVAFLERRLPGGSQNLFPKSARNTDSAAIPYLSYGVEDRNGNGGPTLGNAEASNEAAVHPSAVSVIAQAELCLKGPSQMALDAKEDREEDDVAGIQLADFQERSLRTLVALNPGTNLRDAIKERYQAMGCKEPEAIEGSVLESLLQYAKDICSPRVTGLEEISETITMFGKMVGTGDDERQAAGGVAGDTDADAVRATSIIAKMTEDEMPSRVSVEYAMKALGKTDWKDTRLNPNVPDFLVQYHQAVGKPPPMYLLAGLFANRCILRILDAASYCQMLSSPTRFALAAVGCGVGKTTEAFTTIYMRAREAEARGGPYYPTLFLAPPATVAQVLREGVGFFRGLLTFRLFFGEGRKKEVEPRLQRSVVGPQKFKESIEWCTANKNNPDVAKRVYISSYNTASSRLLVASENPATPGVEPTNPTRARGNSKYTFSRIVRKKGAEVVREYSLREYMQKVRFGLIVLDEAHGCKNPENVYSGFVRTLNAESILAMTATPMPNSVKDIMGMLRLLWSVSVLDPVERFSVGLLSKVFSDGFDPRQRYRGVTPMIDAAAGRGAAYQEGLEAGHRLWILNPTLFEGLADLRKWESTFCDSILREALRIIAVRRTLTSAITLPDSSVRFPGQLIGVDIRVEELSFPDRQADEAAFRANEAIAQVKRHRSRRGNHPADFHDDSEEGEDYDDEEAPFFDHQRSREGRIFFARRRRASLISFDLRNAIMADPEYRSYKDGQFGDREEFPEPPGLADIGKVVDRTGKVIRMGSVQGLGAVGGGVGPLAGTERISKILEDDMDGGASYYYRATCKEEASMPPSARAEMIFYLISKSPALARILIACHQHASDNTKAVFMTNFPWIQQ